MLQNFPENTVNVTYRQNKNLKELISPFLFPSTIKENNCSIEKCNRKCDICKNFLVLPTEFTCHATKQGFLTCNTKNIFYLIACKCCSKQYIGSATGFKERFRIHKPDINTGKIRCEAASHSIYIYIYIYIYTYTIYTICVLVPVLSKFIFTSFCYISFNFLFHFYFLNFQYHSQFLVSEHFIFFLNSR